MNRLERIEDTVFGVPQHNQRGMWERLNYTEELAKAIDGRLSKIVWLLVLGVVGAVLNIALNVKTSSSEKQVLDQIQQTTQKVLTPP